MPAFIRCIGHLRSGERLVFCADKQAEIRTSQEVAEV